MASERKRPRLASPKHSPSRRQQDSPATARWCSIDPNDGRLQCDNSKVKCFLSEKELNDSTAIRNLVQGTDTTLSSRFHPLLFDDDAPTSETTRLRSLPFLRTLKNPEVAEACRTWDAGKKRILALGLRDLYLATMSGSLEAADQGLLKTLVNIVDDSPGIGCVEVDGMGLSFFPSAAFKTVKFVEDLDTKAHGRPDIIPFFAQVLDTPKLFAVFVDPIELSFHNFENIVSLDPWLKVQFPGASSTEHAMDLSLRDLESVQSATDIWTLKLGGEHSAILRRLAALDLFVVPLNKASRGGERFIFNSPLLSKALTTAVTNSGVPGRLDPEDSSFAFVNYVFRCNRFQPGDEPFSQHLDTPYYDSARSQVSRYTLIIYLSPGSNDAGVLQVNDTTITTIPDDITCVIFPQQYAHSGRPFISTTKIFLRTELIFTDPSLSKKKRRRPEIAPLFSSACYLTGHVQSAISPFAEELDARAHALFERANSLHWGLDQTTPSAHHLYLHKRYRAISFLTNGHDYWFRSLPGLALPDCALIALLDYYNVKIASRPFRSLCTTTPVADDMPISSTVSALAFLHDNLHLQLQPATLPRLTEETLAPLFRTTPRIPFHPRPKPSWYDLDEDSEDEETTKDGGCCPTHTWCAFDAWQSEDVAEEYKTCIKFCKKEIYGAGPAVVLGEAVLLNERCMHVEGDRVWFVTGNDGEEKGRINFAACWGDAEEAGPQLYVGLDGEVKAVRAVVPPVTWTEVKAEKGGWHLAVDFWKNDWLTEVEEAKIAVPVITNDVPEEVEEEHIGGKYWRRVKELMGDRGEEMGSLKGSYWTREQDELMSEDEEEEEEEEEEEDDGDEKPRASERAGSGFLDLESNEE